MPWTWPSIRRSRPRVLAFVSASIIVHASTSGHGIYPTGVVYHARGHPGLFEDLGAGEPPRVAAPDGQLERLARYDTQDERNGFRPHRPPPPRRKPCRGALRFRWASPAPLQRTEKFLKSIRE